MRALRMPNIKRGRLTADEKAAIERLAGALKKPTPSAIAHRLNRHPATVMWFMVTRGLIRRKVVYKPAKVGYRPNGAPVHRYTREEDQRLVELRKIAPEIERRLRAGEPLPASDEELDQWDEEHDYNVVSCSVCGWSSDEE